jgi:hypothetical protein
MTCPGGRDPDKDRGVYAKYEVRRRNDPNGKHDDCWYFVLDPTHDPIARVALEAYADEAERRGFEALAADLRLPAAGLPDLAHRPDLLPELPHERGRF